MMDNLKQLAALVQVFQGLQGQNSMGDISQLAQLDMAHRDSGNKQRYYEQNQTLEQQKLDAMLKHQTAQTQMGQDELGLRRQGEQRLLAGQNANNSYHQQALERQNADSKMRRQYYEQLMRASGVTTAQKEQQMQMLQSLLGGGQQQTAQPQLGQAELQFIQQLAEQLKPSQPQPTQ